MDAHAELADLQNRFHLLEGDRKAFYEQSQLTLKQNKEVCDTLRAENKDLRMALSSLTKRGSHGGESNAMLDAESDKIEVKLALLRKRQNQLQDANRNKDIAPFGLPEESDWILNARSRFDRSLMRNAFIYELSNQIGRYAVRTRFVELFKNDNGGNLSYSGDYDGVYTFMEKISRDRDRVPWSASPPASAGVPASREDTC